MSKRHHSNIKDGIRMLVNCAIQPQLGRNSTTIQVMNCGKIFGFTLVTVTIIQLPYGRQATAIWNLYGVQMLLLASCMAAE
jgi:hypothetical protein